MVLFCSEPLESILQSYYESKTQYFLKKKKVRFKNFVLRRLFNCVCEFLNDKSCDFHVFYDIANIYYCAW